MTNSQMLHRIGCELCDWTGTIMSKGQWGTCECTNEAAAKMIRERGLDEDNYMELEGIKKYQPGMCSVPLPPGWVQNR